MFGSKKLGSTADLLDGLLYTKNTWRDCKNPQVQTVFQTNEIRISDVALRHQFLNLLR